LVAEFVIYETPIKTFKDGIGAFLVIGPGKYISKMVRLYQAYGVGAVIKFLRSSRIKIATSYLISIHGAIEVTTY
jgi:hypothetical protein